MAKKSQSRQGLKQLNFLFQESDNTHIAVEGIRDLQTAATVFACIDIGISTPYEAKERCRFKNYGLLNLDKAPKQYGRGPHYIRVELQRVFEEPKLEGRTLGKCLHTPTAVFGRSLPDCEKPDFLGGGNWVDAYIPSHKRIRKGKIIADTRKTVSGYSTFMREKGEPVSLLAPFLKFESTFAIDISDSFVSPFTDEAAKDWIVFIHTRTKSGKRMLHPATIPYSDLRIPKLTYEQLEEVSKIVTLSEDDAF